MFYPLSYTLEKLQMTGITTLLKQECELGNSHTLLMRMYISRASMDTSNSSSKT
jgi:hypothetical protein